MVNIPQGVTIGNRITAHMFWLKEVGYVDLFEGFVFRSVVVEKARSLACGLLVSGLMFLVGFL